MLGHLHLIGSKSLHVVLEELSHIYGSVYELRLGSHQTVVLCDKKSVKEAFVKKAKDFSGRPDLPTFSFTRQNCIGVSLCDYSEHYLSNRKKTVQVIHKFLMNEENIDRLFQKESSKMVELLDGYVESEKSFYPLGEFEKIIPSLFLSLMYGIHLSYDDDELKNIVSMYQKWFNAAEADNPADFFPLLSKLPNKRLAQVTECGREFEKYNLARIKKEILLKRDGNNNKEECETTDTLLRLLIRDDDISSFDDLEFCRETAKIISDMIGGGFDTSTAILSWAILYLINNPSVIEKCRQELSAAANQGNILVRYKSACPYFSATIYEILRLSCVAPTGIIHSTTCNSTIQGMPIDKDTIVIANLRQLNYDTNDWAEPHKFRPERFFKSGTDELDSQAINNIATFSAGVRRCPGDKIAFSMIFVLLGTIIERYDIQLMQPPEDMEPIRGMTSKPKHYLVELSQKTV